MNSLDSHSDMINSYFDRVQGNILELIYMYTGIARKKKETDQQYINRVAEVYPMDVIGELVKELDLSQ